jgi:hypothetical protein
MVATRGPATATTSIRVIQAQPSAIALAWVVLTLERR